MNDRKSTPTLSFDHMTVMHIQEALAQSQAAVGQQTELQKHMTTAHLAQALSSAPAPAPAAQPASTPPAKSK
jgi:hypothetical protein